MTKSKSTTRPANLDLRSLLPPEDEFEFMIEGWLAEDIGRLDLTTEIMIPADARAEFVLNTRDDIVVCGVDVAAHVFRYHVPDCQVEVVTRDGTRAAPGTALAKVSGPRTRSPDLRTHRAQHASAALRDRHPYQRIRATGGRNGRNPDRHAQDHPGSPPALQIRGLRRRRPPPSGRAARRRDDQGQPHRGSRQHHKCRGPGPRPDPRADQDRGRVRHLGTGGGSGRPPAPTSSCSTTWTPI